MNKREYVLAFKEIFLSAINTIFLVVDGLVFLLSLFSKSLDIPTFVYWVIFVFGFFLSSLQLIIKKNKQIAELGRKSEVDNKLYELEKRDIESKYEENIEEVRGEYSDRGLSGSGLENKSIGRVEAEKNRQIEKLKLKYRK